MSIVAALLNSMGHLSVELTPLEPIRLLSQAYQVNFPREIVFTATVNGNQDITEVTLFYQIGTQSTMEYRYGKFTPSRIINVTIKVKTSGTSYMPAGADIRYHYLIEDSVGNLYQTETFNAEYKDPTHDWQRLELDGLSVIWHDLKETEVRPVAETVQQRIKLLKTLLRLDHSPSIKAVILNTSREAEVTFPYISQASHEGHFYGGFAFPEADLFLLAGLSTTGMSHEITHLMLDEAMTSAAAQIPAWLNEGLATYFEFQKENRNDLVLKAARDGDLTSLATMKAMPGELHKIRLFYSQSWSVVDFMMRTYEEKQMAVLLNHLRSGDSVDEAMIQAYNLTTIQLETTWIKSLTSKQKTQQPRTSTEALTILGPTLGMFMIGMIMIGTRIISANRSRNS